MDIVTIETETYPKPIGTISWDVRLGSEVLASGDVHGTDENALAAAKQLALVAAIGFAKHFETRVEVVGVGVCNAPGCFESWMIKRTAGRRRQYCSSRCRVRHHRKTGSIRRIGLVACSKKKREARARAVELYDPSWSFRKARAIVRERCDAWWVLSAKHGLVHPGAKIDPYDLTLARLSRAERREWAEWVAGQLRQRYQIENTHFLVLAGRHYAAALDGFPQMETPLAGLGTGHQRHWLSVNAPAE